MKHGGKRKNSGRPIGTTKPDNKKMVKVSFGIRKDQHEFISGFDNQSQLIRMAIDIVMEKVKKVEKT